MHVFHPLWCQDFFFDIITCTKFKYDVVGLLVGIVVDGDAVVGFEVWMEVVALDRK